MNSGPRKLEQRQKEQTAETRQQEERTAAREFASAEELIRFDAAQAEVPERVKTRLEESIQREPPPKPEPFWRRFFKK